MKAILDKDEVSGRLWTGILEDRSFGKELGTYIYAYIYVHT